MPPCSIIRILFMVPVYAISSFLSIQWYWHAVYFQVISDCYEAFAIASFFALICHYVAPDLHSQKAFFREMRPVKPWVLPINWFAKCCGGQRGIWRTPKSGLTWFNIIWIGVYHYCFIRVVMTIAAVVSQHFKRYCESSNSPVFGHIWVRRHRQFFSTRKGMSFIETHDADKHRLSCLMPRLSQLQCTALFNSISS